MRGGECEKENGWLIAMSLKTIDAIQSYHFLPGYPSRVSLFRYCTNFKSHFGIEYVRNLEGNDGMNCAWWYFEDYCNQSPSFSLVTLPPSTHHPTPLTIQTIFHSTHKHTYQSHAPSHTYTPSPTHQSNPHQSN